MLAGQSNQVTVGDLIRTAHQIRSYDTVFATQIIRDETVARVGKQMAQNDESLVGCHAITEQRVR